LSSIWSESTTQSQKYNKILALDKTGLILRLWIWFSPRIHATPGMRSAHRRPQWCIYLTIWTLNYCFCSSTHQNSSDDYIQLTNLLLGRSMYSIYPTAATISTPTTPSSATSLAPTEFLQIYGLLSTHKPARNSPKRAQRRAQGFEKGARETLSHRLRQYFKPTLARSNQATKQTRRSERKEERGRAEMKKWTARS
jgi:hypothetical protein